MIDFTGWGALASIVVSVVGFLTLWFNAKRAKSEREDQRDALAAQAEEVRRDAKDQAEIVRQAVDAAENRLMQYHQLIHSTQTEIKTAIDRNTDLTTELGEKADAAYDIANHINEKIVDTGLKLAKAVEKKK